MKNMSETDRRKIKDKHIPVLHALNELFQAYEHTVEKRTYGRKWIFPNGMWLDLLGHQEKSPASLRLNRGAWLAKEYPALGLLFDETLTVIAKINLNNTQDIEKKAIKELIKLVSKAPSGVGYIGLVKQK